MGRDGVAIHLTLDVPDALLAARAPGADDPAAALARELPHALTLTLDGEDVPLTASEPSLRVDLVDHTATLVDMTWSAEVPLAGRHTLQVGNAALSDRPCWFLDRVTVPAEAEVHGLNLWRSRRWGEEDLSEQWVRTELLRTVRLDVALPDGPLAPALASLGAPPRRATEARAVSRATAWREGRLTPTTLTGSLVVSALLGLGTGLGGVRPRALVAGAVLALAAWWAVPPAGALAIPVAFAAVFLAADPPLGRVLALIGAAWAAASLPALGGLAASAAWLAAAFLGRVGAPAPRLAPFVLALGAVVASLRG